MKRCLELLVHHLCQEFNGEAPPVPHRARLDMEPHAWRLMTEPQHGASPVGASPAPRRASTWSLWQAYSGINPKSYTLYNTKIMAQLQHDNCLYKY